jgi:hypothetical protein
MYYPETCLKGLNTWKCQHPRCPDRDSKGTLPEYKNTALTLSHRVPPSLVNVSEFSIDPLRASVYCLRRLLHYTTTTDSTLSPDCTYALRMTDSSSKQPLSQYTA